MRRLVSILFVVSMAPALVAAGGQVPSTSQSAATAPRKPEPDAAYYFLAARHLENTGKIDEAAAALRTAISLEPGSAELRAELAGLFARQNNAVDAMNAADEALKIDPENREANRTLGSIYAALSEQKRPI